MPDYDDAHGGYGSSPIQPFWKSRAFLVFLAFAVMALVLLWQEHSAHILGAIPYLFLLVCPLMHVFMHGGHRHDRASGLPPEQSLRAYHRRDGGSDA